MPKTIQVNSENNNVKNNYSVNNSNNNKATTVGGYRNDRKPKAGIYDRYNVVTEQFELFTPKVIEMEKSEVTIKIENSIKYLENIKNSLEEEKQKLINKRQSFDAMARNGKYSGLFYEGNSKGVKNCLNPDEALKSNAFFVKYLKDNGYKTDRDKMSSDEYRKLQKEFAQYINTVYTDKYNEYFSQYVGMTYADYKNKISSLNSDITTIKASKYELVQQAKEQPYLELLNTEELKNYVANNYNNKNSKLYFLNGISNGTITLADNSMRFNYLTEQDRMIYSYLYDTQSAFAAGEFLKAIEDKLNKAEGLANAEKFLDKIRDGDGNIDPTVISGLLSSGHGVSNGLTSFFDGFAGVISDEGMMTTTQYEQMYILSELTNSSGNYINKIATSISESRGEEAANEFMRNIYVNNSINLEYAKKVLSDKQYTNLIKKMEVDDKSILDNCYELGTSAGNMLPSVVVSIGVTALLPGVGITVAGELMTVGSLTGSTLMGISAAGNARNQALIQGNSKYSSTMYGLFSGISETTLGLLLGNIPGLNANASFSVKGILKEGFEEMVQEYFDAGLRTAILDETIDISELSKDALKSFIYGSIMSGVMNGGQLSLTIIGDSIGAGRVKISNVQELTSFVDSYCKDMDIDIPRVESTVSKVQNTSISSIESQIATANMYTDKGNFASIDVSDINLITDEVLSKIKNIDNVIFRMPDGENISISQLLSRRNSAKVVSDNVTNNARNNIENSNTHVEQNVSNARDSIHDIESQIATANMYTDRGNFASIDVSDINLITDEVLSKIKNIDNVIFRMPDGSSISYDELILRIGNTSIDAEANNFDSKVISSSFTSENNSSLSEVRESIIAVTTDIDVFSNFTKKLFSMEDSDLPNGFSSVDEYKNYVMDVLIDSGKINTMDNRFISYLFQDSVTLDKLIACGRTNYLIIKNLVGFSNGVARLLKKASVEQIDGIFNTSEVSDYIMSLKPEEFNKVLSSFDKANISFLQSEIFLEKLKTLSVEEFYDAISHFYKQSFLIKKSVETNKSDEYISFLEYVSENFVKEDIFYENPKYINLIENIVLGYSDNEQIDTLCSTINSIKKDSLLRLQQNIIDNSDIIMEHKGSTLGISENIEDNTYYTVKYEVDGKVETIDILSFFKSLYFREIIDSTALSKGKEGKFKILSVEKNTIKTKLILDEKKGISDGLNRIKLLIDGEEITILEMARFQKIDLSNKFKYAKSAELISVEPIVSQNVSVSSEFADSLYNVSYTVDGISKSFYIVADKNGNINIDDFLIQYNIYDFSSIDNITKVDPKEIKINMDYMNSKVGVELFSDTKYGGNQSDVSNIISASILKKQLSTLELYKADTIKGVIRKYYPNVSDTEMINLTEKYSDSGCGYMALANSICLYMGNLENGGELFKQKFGYDLYFDNNGSKSYNVETVALDLFLSRFSDMSCTDIINTSEALGMRSLSNDYENTAKKLLEPLGINTSVVSNDSFRTNNSALSLILNSDDSSFKILSAFDFDMELLLGDISATNHDKALSNSVIKSNVVKDVGGHAMLITGLDDYNNLIVSSWSQKYKFLIDSIKRDARITSIKYEMR